jgi:4-hydroxy-3-polyprenylbenzoate decarboxylase
MLKLTRLGAIVMPPVPAFYSKPRTVDDIVTQIAARGLELLGIDIEEAIVRWQGAAAIDG